MKDRREMTNSKEVEFVVFCIENISLRLGISASRVYDALAKESDILNGYIIPEYEILHTQSKEYIIDDILELMGEKGVAL